MVGRKGVADSTACITGFVDRRECQKLIELHDAWSIPNDGYMPGFRTARFHELHDSAPPSALRTLDRIRHAIRDEVRRRFPLRADRPLLAQYTGLESTTIGCEFKPHADNLRYDPDRGDWVKPPYAFRVRSAILYLNDSGVDFDGGVFQFLHARLPRASGHLHVRKRGAPVVPRAGTLLMFTSGTENVHRVSKVTRGRRYTLAMWFAESAAVCEPQRFGKR